MDQIAKCVVLPVVLTGSAVAAVAPALAETRQAVIVALRSQGQNIGQPAADALAVSRAALIAGFDVRRLEQPTMLPAPPAQPPDVMLIYVSGDSAVQDGHMRMGPFDLAQIVTRYSSAGQVILLAETCPVSGVSHSEIALPEPAENTTVALSQTPDLACGGTRLTDVVITALTTPGQDLGQALFFAGLPLSKGKGATAFLPLPDAQKPAGNDTLILSAPLTPVNEPVVVLASGMRAPVAQAGTGVRIFDAANAPLTLSADRLARPTAQGLPEPSVIVGDAPPVDGAPPAVGQTLAGEALGGTFEDRERIRADNPGLFNDLLASGAFDPETEQIAVTIQSELQRMNCYSGTIDGIWGNGSRGAVDRYFAQAGGNAPVREPEVALFRALAGGPADLRCPAPVTLPTAAASRRSTAQEPARRQDAPRQQTPAEQTAPSSRQINPNALGSGAFR